MLNDYVKIIELYYEYQEKIKSEKIIKNDKILSRLTCLKDLSLKEILYKNYDKKLIKNEKIKKELKIIQMKNNNLI